MSKAVSVIAGGVALAFGGSLLLAGAIGIGAAAAVDFITDQLVPDVDNSFNDPLDNQRISTNANQPRKLIYGETAVGGQIIGYTKVTQGEDEYDMLAIHIAGHACDAVSILEIEGKTPAEYGDAVQAEFLLGDQTTVSQFALDHLYGWTDKHIGYGQTLAYLKIKKDPELFPSLNDIKFLVRGKKIYDPRLDSTAGGNGAHRKDDPDTWEWSQNPELCAVDCARFHGHRPISDRRIAWDFVALAANYCDEQAAYKDEGGVTRYETRFTCNGVLKMNMKPGDMLKAILGSMGGQVFRPGGRIYFKPSMYTGPATITLTPADFIERPTYQPHRPIKELVNLVRGEYVEPSLKYQTTDAKFIDNALYIEQDGIILPHTLKNHMTNKGTVSNRLQRHFLERARAGFIVQSALKKIRLDIVPGSVVRYVDVESNINKEFVVKQYAPDFARQTTTVAFEEDGEAIYPDGFEPAVADLTPNTTLPDPTLILPVENLAYTATPNDSFRQGKLTWTHPVPNSVTRYVVLITDNPDTGFSQGFFPIVPELDIVNLPAGAYTALVSAQNRFDKSAPAVVLNFSVGLPNTPTGQVRVDKLPGRVHLVAPEAPNPSASYQWRYSFVDNFASAIDGGTNTAITVTNTPHNGTLYVWYRLVDGDLADATWLQIVVPNLIGISSEVIAPETIAAITIPGLPSSLGETIRQLIHANQDMEHWSFEIETRLSETDLDLESKYVQIVDLFAENGAARASELNQLSSLVGNTSVASQITEFRQTQIGYLDENGNWREGAAFAQAFNNVQISGRFGDGVSIYSYFQALEDELGRVNGEIQLAVDVNGRITGMFIQGSDTQSNIIFSSQFYQVVNTDGTLRLGINNATGEFEFNGSGTFTGRIRSAKIELIGDAIMEITDPNGFGPDNLYFWSGERMLDSNGDPDFSQLSKSNADEWKDLTGNRYFGGTLSAGIYRNAARSNSLTNFPEIQVGPFPSFNGIRTILLGFKYQAQANRAGACGSQMTPSVSIQLQRSLGGSAFSDLGTPNVITGSLTLTPFVEPGINECESFELINSSVTITDTTTSTANIEYRAVVVGRSRYHTQSETQLQEISIAVTEEP